MIGKIGKCGYYWDGGRTKRKRQVRRKVFGWSGEADEKWNNARATHQNSRLRKTMEVHGCDVLEDMAQR